VKLVFDKILTKNLLCYAALECCYSDFALFVFSFLFASNNLSDVGLERKWKCRWCVGAL